MMNVLLAWLWQGTLVAVVATAAVRFVPPGAAAKRYAVWWLALAFVVALPFMPAAPLVPVSEAPAAASAASGAASVAPGVVLPAPPAWLASGLILAWGVTLLAALSRLLLDARHLRTLTRGARPIDPAREARLVRWMEARNLSRPVRLQVSDGIRGACAIGFFTPTLLLSSTLVETLDDEAIEGIVLHEYAHLERYDDWTGLLQRLVLAVAGAHPAVRWISRGMTLEREIACDQRVVVLTGAPIGYARSLANAAAVASRGRRRAPALAPGSSTTKPMLVARIERLLSCPAASARAIWGGVLSGGAMIAAAVVTIAQASTLVTFAALPAVFLASTSPWSKHFAHLPHSVGFAHDVDAPDTPGAPALMTRAVLEDLRAVSGQQAVSLAPDRADASQETPGALPMPASAAAVLASRQVSAVFAQAPSFAAAAADDGLVQPFALIGSAAIVVGTTAADAGVATGQGASRAGTSIGRWFKNRGVAVARSF